MQKKIVFVILMMVLIIPNIYASDNDFLTNINGIYDNLSGSYNINGDVRFAFKDIEIGSAEAKRYPFGSYIIVLDSNKLGDANDFELEGMLAHELAHLESYSKMSFLGFIIFAVRYGISEKYRTKTERETDIRAIDKGFGNELLAFREYRLNSASEKEVEILNKNYLSVEEIEELV